MKVVNNQAVIFKLFKNITKQNLNSDLKFIYTALQKKMVIKLSPS